MHELYKDLKENYKNWIIENGLDVAKIFLEKTFETAVLTVEDKDIKTKSDFDTKIIYNEENKELHIYFTNSNNEQITYTINSNSGALHTLANSYYEIETLLSQENITYEEARKGCINATNAVKLFIVSGVQNDSTNNLSSEKTEKQARKMIQK
jgi:hypothetical protein